MKNLGIIFAGMLSLAASIAHASVSVEVDAGVLRTAAGAPLTSGLLQLVALRTSTGTFTTPTATSFVGGDTANELVIASVNFQQGGAGFVTGEADNVFRFTYENATSQNSPTTFDPGDELLLRWYPTLTATATAPGALATFGQYRSSTAPDGGIAFFGPPDGNTLTLPNGFNFLTATAGGSNLDLTGFASNVVVGVPEPSSYAFALGCIAGLVVLVRQRSVNLA